MLTPLAGNLSPLGRAAGKGPSSLLSGLAMWWSFEDNSNLGLDSVGANHLTVFNVTQADPGKIGKGVLWAGTDSTARNLRLPDSPAISGGARSFEMCMWIRPSANAAPGSAFSNVAAKRDAGNEWFVQLQGGTGSVGVRWWARSSAAVVKEITHSTPCPHNVWSLVNWWFDSPGQILGVSINGGAAQTVATGWTTMIDTTSMITFGSQASTGGEVFAGQMDEGGRWNDRILTAAERVALYNAGAGKRPPF